MLVVIADSLPPAVRGKLKIWFIEPKPNIFVSSVSDAIARRVVENLLQVCPPESGMLIIESRKRLPGYFLWEKRKTQVVKTVAGFQLVKKLSSTPAD